MELVTFVLGLLVGWGIQHWYSRRSSAELQAIFRAFAQLAEERGWVEWQRDKDGSITTGRVIRGRVEATLDGLTSTITGTVGPPK